jgi:hypothetical protein
MDLIFRGKCEGLWADTFLPMIGESYRRYEVAHDRASREAFTTNVHRQCVAAMTAARPFSQKFSCRRCVRRPKASTQSGDSESDSCSLRPHFSNFCGE